MTIYTDVRDGVYTWTKRPDLTVETDTFIRQAVNNSHRAGTFDRDLVQWPVTGLSLDQIQTIDLTTAPSPLRRILTVGPTGLDQLYKKIDAYDLLDPDGYGRVNIWYQVGTNLLIRANGPTDAVTVTYFRKWTVSPIAALDSWIAQDYMDLIICSAAASVLAAVNEQEIKTRVEAIAASELARLIDERTIQG